jgi:hypothetical protein
MATSPQLFLQNLPDTTSIGFAAPLLDAYRTTNLT